MRIARRIQPPVYPGQPPFWKGFIQGLFWTCLVGYPIILAGWALYWWAW